MDNLKTTIFTKSYSDDTDWLFYLLSSIKKYGSGYHDVVIVSEDDLSGMAHSFGFTFLPCNPPPVAGYMWQQAIKMHADSYVPDADWIMFVDSDCIFTGPHTPETWMKEGRPYLYMSEYEKLGNERVWKEPTETAIGIPWTHDMTHDVMLFSKKHLASTRERIEEIHKMNTMDYIISKSPRCQFSEFNAIGTWCANRFGSDFCLVDKKGGSKPYFPCKNHWSWGGLTDGIRAELESIIA